MRNVIPTKPLLQKTLRHVQISKRVDILQNKKVEAPYIDAITKTGRHYKRTIKDDKRLKKIDVAALHINAKQLKKRKYNFNRESPSLIKPGQCLNPHGRPKKENCIPDILRGIGKQQGSPEIIRQLTPHFPTVDLKNATCLQILLYTCYLNAKRGDDASRSFIADRTEGKVKEHLAITDDSIVVDIEDADYTDEPKKGEEIGTDEKDKSSDTPDI